MRIDNEIYFAPDIRFVDLLNSEPSDLIEAFSKRVFLYYLEPPRVILAHLDENQIPLTASHGYAFTIGTICVTTIDFLAGFMYGVDQQVRVRFVRWLRNFIPYFNELDPNNNSQSLAHRFYDEFRNGLVHNGRIKNAGQFSFDSDLSIENELVNVVDDAMVINSGYLHHFLCQSFVSYISSIEDQNAFKEKFMIYFADDFNYISTH